MADGNDDVASPSRQKALFELARDLSSTLELDEVARAFAAHAPWLTGGEARIWLVHDRPRRLAPLSGGDAERPLADDATELAVIRSGRPLRTPSLFILPLTASDRAIGVIEVDGASTAQLASGGMQYWRTLGEIVGAAVENARRHEKLMETANRFRSLVEQIPVVTYIDRAGTGEPIYVSPQIETVIGVPAAEWLADSDAWTARIHPDDRDPASAAYRRTIENGRAVRVRVPRDRRVGADALVSRRGRRGGVRRRSSRRDPRRGLRDHRAQGGRAGHAGVRARARRCRAPLPLAGGAAAARHLHRRTRRGGNVALQQPAERRHHRLHACRVGAGSRPLRQDHPRGRPQARARRLRGRPDRRHAVRERIPHRAARRHHGVGARRVGGRPRCHRRGAPPAGLPARHHPAQARRGAARAPGLPRLADRPPEPRPLLRSTSRSRWRVRLRPVTASPCSTSTSTTSSS